MLVHIYEIVLWMKECAGMYDNAGGGAGDDDDDDE
jgi:hypothetical protein